MLAKSYYKKAFAERLRLKMIKNEFLESQPILPRILHFLIPKENKANSSTIQFTKQSNSCAILWPLITDGKLVLRVVWLQCDAICKRVPERYVSFATPPRNQSGFVGFYIITFGKFELQQLGESTWQTCRNSTGRL